MSPEGGVDALPVLRLAYQPPPYTIERLELVFELDAQCTRVQSTMVVRRAHDAVDAALALDGEKLALLAVRLDGRSLQSDEYHVSPSGLSIPQVPASFTLEIESTCNPAANTALEGLYLTNGTFCTQCEAEGFRRITYFPDRPDVLTIYTVELRADAAAFPVLLANGDRVAGGLLPDGRAWARWHDPWPKPSYLFALVAGRLESLDDEFITRSNRHVALQIFSTPANLPQCAHAMTALKAAMRWDEETHDLEYDLDRFMIFCADDFNLGAMENKGLNVFNARMLLASPERTSDEEYARIEAIVAHEYFHNWTGNRVTCRDWFQLSLKEGWTVFRDQEFSADRGSRAVARIAQTSLLREQQWPEDAGPQAHPVRPDSYLEINNFYTRTVYEKGAEVIRMLHTLIGADAYRRGTDLYFARHDGTAVTCDDFLRAMADASGSSLEQFGRWYAQAGTPHVRVEVAHDRESRQLELRLTQSCPPTRGQPRTEPLHIPVRMALIAADGSPVPLRLSGATRAAGAERVIELTAATTTFSFADVPPRTVPSLFRGFSAPVSLELDLADDDLEFLLAHDDDPCNRWEAMQQIQARAFTQLLDAQQVAAEAVPKRLIAAFRSVLENDDDPAWQAATLRLPAFSTVADLRGTIDVERIHSALLAAWEAIATALRPQWEVAWHRGRAAASGAGAYAFDAAVTGARALANRALHFLARDPAGRTRALEQFAQSDNMTDTWGALIALNDCDGTEREAATAAFRERWQREPLLLDKWHSLEATSVLPGRLAVVARIWQDPGFDRRNPNRVRALLNAFAHYNWPHFHAADGGAYAFIADQVLALDRRSPQLGAKLAQAFDRWQRFDASRCAMMRAQLERIVAQPGLSRNVKEVATNALAN